LAENFETRCDGALQPVLCCHRWRFRSSFAPQVQDSLSLRAEAHLNSFVDGVLDEGKRAKVADAIQNSERL